MSDLSCPKCRGYSVTQMATDDAVQVMRCLFVGPLLVDVVFGSFTSLNAWATLVLFELLVSAALLYVYRRRRARPDFLLRQSFRCDGCRHRWHRNYPVGRPQPQPSVATAARGPRRSWFSSRRS